LLAEFFANYFLYQNRFLFVLYNHDAWEQSQYGIKRSHQRWEQCSGGVFDYQMKPAYEFLNSRKYFDAKISEAAKSFAREAVEFAIKKIKKGQNRNETAKELIIERLKKTEIIAGIHEDLLKVEKVEEFYDELELKGDESYTKTYLDILKYNKKLELEPKESWKRNLNEKSFEFNVKYYAEENILCKKFLKTNFAAMKTFFVSDIPFMWITYPWYHPERPRFFNTATLFPEVITSIYSGLSESYKNFADVFKPLGKSLQLAYENFVEWENSGGKDLQLGSNRLTNRQLYWVAFARTFYHKYHDEIVPKDYEPYRRLQQKYFHVWMKQNSGFQEAFNCSMTNSEEIESEKFLKEFKNMFG
jgi:hypothetical protein